MDSGSTLGLSLMAILTPLPRPTKVSESPACAECTYKCKQWQRQRYLPMVRLLRAAADTQTPMVLFQVVICHIQYTCNDCGPTAHALHMHMPCKYPKPIHTCKLGCMGAYCAWLLDIAVCTLHSMTYLPTHCILFARGQLNKPR